MNVMRTTAGGYRLVFQYFKLHEEEFNRFIGLSRIPKIISLV